MQSNACTVFKRNKRRNALASEERKHCPFYIYSNVFYLEKKYIFVVALFCNCTYYIPFWSMDIQVFGL